MSDIQGKSVDTLIIDEVADAPARVAVAAGNPEQIVWPYDDAGFLAKLRSEIVRAASRVNGHPEKLKTFTETMRTGAQHGILRFRGQQAGNEAQLTRLAEEQEAANQAGERQRLALVAQLEKQLDAVKGSGQKEPE